MSKETLVTPKGRANYTWLSRPDTKFDADGVYTVTVCLDKDEAKPLCKVLKKEYDAAQKPKKKKGNPPYKENENGEIEIKLKQKAIIRNKAGEEFKKTVAILDAKKKPIKADVGNGSTVKAAFSIRPYDYNGCGLSLDLIAVQVIDLVEYDGNQEFGFDEEDGFEGTIDNSPQQAETPFDNQEEEETDTGDEDDDSDEPF
jgi:hypothetical protein